MQFIKTEGGGRGGPGVVETDTHLGGGGMSGAL